MASAGALGREGVRRFLCGLLRNFGEAVEDDDLDELLARSLRDLVDDLEAAGRDVGSLHTR
jgi:hypothetical protein